MQDIVIDKSVLKEIANPNNLFNLRIYRDNLKNKRIVFDGIGTGKSKLFSEYKEMLESLNSDALSRLNIIIGQHIVVSNRIVFIKVNNTNDVFSELINTTPSKIGNSENQQHRMLAQRGCDVLSIDEFCDPPNKSRVLNIPRKIELQKNEEFRLHEVLKSYFEGCYDLKIYDRYIFTDKSYNLFKLIISSCGLLKSIKVNTNVNINAQNKEHFINFKSIDKIEVNHISNEYHDRKIIIDNEIQIDLSSGLDFVNNQFRVWRDSVMISIKRINNY